MKRVWIFNSRDDPGYFSNPKNAYEEAVKFHKMPRYSLYLKFLRVDGYYEIEEGISIVVQPVK